MDIVKKQRHRRKKLSYADQSEIFGGTVDDLNQSDVMSMSSYRVRQPMQWVNATPPDTKRATGVAPSLLNDQKSEEI